MRRAPHNAGFTLVEVMLAVAILASLTALMWASIANMFATRDVIEARTERYHQVRVTMNRMAKEIAAAYIAGPEFGAELLPGEESMATMTVDEQMDEAKFQASGAQRFQFGMIGRDGKLNFTTMAHVRTMDRERASDHAEIGYFTRTDRNEEGRMVKMLMRREDVSADDDLEKGGVVYKMLPELDKIEFEYWDPGPVKLGTFEELAQGRWVKDWDTTRRDQAGRLPTRVRIRLVLPPPNERSEPEVFVTQAEIATTEVLEF